MNRRDFLKATAMGVVFAGWKGVFAESAELAQPIEAFRNVIKSKDRKVFGDAALRLRRWMLAHEPHYPRYHFSPPEAWINDPKGLIYHKGKYHLFFQYDPTLKNGQRSLRTWGHAVSTDLLHWVDWPVAMWPDIPEDLNGVYSGNCVIDSQGRLAASYTGSAPGGPYGILARSSDEGVTWEKKVVMRPEQRPEGVGTIHWDAQVWKEGDTWCQLIGHGGGHLWKSKDLENWVYQKEIFEHPGLGSTEYPYLVPLGDRYMFIAGSIGGAWTNPYWIGTYDKETMTFSADSKNPHVMDPGYMWTVNPSWQDNKGPDGAGRRIMIGWVPGKTDKKTLWTGMSYKPVKGSSTPDVPWWDGSMTLPRVISLKRGRLNQEPVAEIEKLRGTKRSVGKLSLPGGTRKLLPDAKGHTQEIIVSFTPEAGACFGLNVRVSEDKKERIRVWYNSQTKELGIADRKRSVDIPGDRPVTMRLFLDRSLLELYMDGYTVTYRTYMDIAATDVEVFAENAGVVMDQLECWKMKDIW